MKKQFDRKQINQNSTIRFSFTMLTITSARLVVLKEATLISWFTPPHSWNGGTVRTTIKVNAANLTELR